MISLKTTNSTYYDPEEAGQESELRVEGKPAVLCQNAPRKRVIHPGCFIFVTLRLMEVC